MLKLLFLVLFIVQINGDNNGECKDTNLNAKKTGRKAWDKCLEYQEKLVYPCVGSDSAGGPSKKNNCHHDADNFNAGDAAKNEFPHMVLLGYGEPNEIKWLCSGSLISERFILTAGQCLINHHGGNPTYAYIGAHQRSELNDTSRLYGIKNIIEHPEHKPSHYYNDILLLETDRTVQLDEFTVPACLHIGDEADDETVLATIWGYDERTRNISGSLRKVILKKFSQDECSKKYPTKGRLYNGIDVKTQICYGAQTKFERNCQGDAGIGILVKNKVDCMYTINGIPSFGPGCDYVDHPVVYTRVSHYVPWIEGIVWP